MIIDFKKQKLRILITGGAGFIGGCLIRRLLKEENIKVFNLDKISYASDLSWLKNISNATNHFLLKADLSNHEETNNAIKKANPDLIIHLAAESHVDRSIENALPFIESNILGTFNLLDNTYKYWQNLEPYKKNRFRILYVSTDEVFGSLGPNGFFDESSNYDPRSPYSASKASSDHLVNAWLHTFNLPIIRTNCSNNYGPYQFPEKLIPLTILKALKNEPLPIYGDGTNIRDWIYVEDHIDALLLTISRGSIGSNYCIGGDNQKTNLTIVNHICEQIDILSPQKTSRKNLINFVKDRPGHDKRYAINSNLIKKELNWTPKNSFEEGINKTLNWYINNLNWCNEIQNKSNYKGQRLGIKS